MAPVGKYKVLFLENIERMSVGAANALLKPLEEPLPNRLIIATTTQESQLLDTILSRAMVVRFQSLIEHNVRNYLQTRHSLTCEQVDFIASFSQGKI